MAILTSPQAERTYQLSVPASAGAICASYGTLAITANPARNDIWQMLRVPRDALVLGGFLYAGILDSNATKAIDLDFGWQANSDEPADLSGFGKASVNINDPINVAAAGYQYLLGGTLKSGPKRFTQETVLCFVVMQAPATFVPSSVSAVALYRM